MTLDPLPCLCPRCPKHVIDRLAAYCGECDRAGCSETHVGCRQRPSDARKEYQGERARHRAIGRMRP